MVALQIVKCLVIVLLTATSFVHCRYEDQAGKFDWHKQFVGKPSFVHFSEPAAQQSATGTVYVGTQSGVVSALNANRGDVVWRVAAESGARILSLLETKDQVVALIELDGKFVMRSFHMVGSSSSGLISWETMLNASLKQCEHCSVRAFVIRVSSDPSLASRVAVDSQSLLAVAFETHLFIVRARDGEVLSRTEVALSTADKQQVNVDWLDSATGFSSDADTKFESARLLAAVSVGSQRRQVGVVDVIVSDDPSSFEKTPIFEPVADLNRVRADTCVLVGTNRDRVACASREPDSRQLLVFTNEQQVTPINIDLDQGSAKSARIRFVKRVALDATCSAFAAYGELLVINDALVRIDLQSRCVETLARGVLAQRVSAACESDALRIATLSTAASADGQELVFRLLKLTEPITEQCPSVAVEQVLDARIRMPTGYPAIELDTLNEHEHGWLSVRWGESGAFSAARCLVLLADDSVHLFSVSSKPGSASSASLSAISASMKHAWTREESLARIELAEFVDLPVSVTFDNNADEAESEADEPAADEPAARHFLETVRRSAVAFRRRIEAQFSQLHETLTSIVQSFTDTNRALSVLTALARLDFATLNRLVQSGADSFAAQTGNTVSESPTDLERMVQPKTDYFNLNKMLVLATSVGKIFGVESASGRIVWRTYNAGWRERRKEALYKLHTAVDEPRRCALVGSDVAVQPDGELDSSAANAADRQLRVHVLIFDPISGNLLVDEAVGDASSTRYTVIDLDLAAFHDEADAHEHDASDPDTDAYAFRKPLLLFDTVQESATLFGATRAAARAFVRFVRRRALSFYTVDRERAVLTGYRLTLDPSATASPSRSETDASAEWNVPIRVSRSWSVAFGTGVAGAKQQLMTVATRLAHEPLHSIGRPLGDRNVLYKYVNPNVIAVAMQASYVQDDQARTLVSLHLIDTVSGQFIYQAQHKRASGPVHITVSENWLLYSFMNRKKYGRQEIVSVEFFEGSKRFNSTAFSAFQSRPIYPSSQAFYMHMPIEAMRVTWTAAGITTKSVLLALANGAIAELPKAFFDSRRTMNYTLELQEEGLLQYAPELPIVPQAVLTYGRALHGVRQIVTTPTGLESTCLAIAFGGPDVFFDRVAPSRMYDVLKEDFEYALIATVTLGLLGGAFVLRQLAFRRALRKAWYS